MVLLEQFERLTLHPRNAAKLRELVLQLAVQGKLTANWRQQNPNVEPASELLKRIEAEKAKLVKEKKISKEQPILPIYDDEVIFDLPEGWEWCRLKQLGYCQTGSTPSKSNSKNTGDFIPFIGPGNISASGIDYSGEGLSEEGLTNGRLIPRGSILMVCIGGSIGKLQICDRDVSCNQQLNTVTPLVVSSNLVRYLLSSPYFQKLVKEKASGSATPIINKGKWESIPVPLPPLAEQEAIVARVEELMQKIDELELQAAKTVQLQHKLGTAALQKLSAAPDNELPQHWHFLKQNFHTLFSEEQNVKKLRETILQLAVKGKITANWRQQNPNVEPASELLKRIKAEKEKLVKEKKIAKEKPLPPISEEEVPYELPEGWEWCKLEDLADITSGVTKGKIYKGNVIETPYLRVANVQRGRLDLNVMKTIIVSEDDYKKYQLEPNDLLMIEGGDPDKLGRCAIWNNEIEKCIYQNHVFRVRPFSKKKVSPNYLTLFINSPITREYYEKCAKRTTNLASINKTQMRSTHIALPPVSEQEEIFSKVEELMQLCDGLELQIQQSEKEVEKLMQAVVQEALEGKAELV